MPYPPLIDPRKETARIIKFLRETFKNAGKSQAVIPVSGGVDSATSLLLTAKALSPQDIHVLLLPSRTTNPLDLTHANLAAQISGIPKENLTTIPISAIIQKTWRIINRYTKKTETGNRSEGRPIFAGSFGQAESLASYPATKRDTKLNRSDQKNVGDRNNQATKQTVSPDATSSLNRLRLANITARVRMIVIFDQAKLHDALVAGTENRSEYLLGYYTRFGDEASDIEPVRHLYKTQVRELAKYLKIPDAITSKIPTAGLWHGQTDEGELGFSYDEADPILYLHFEQHLTPKQITKKMAILTHKTPEQAEALVSKVLVHCQQYEFKHHLPYSLNS